MFRETKAGWESHNPSEGWSPCNSAAIIDAGDNIIEERPAQQHATLATKYRVGIHQGRFQLIGVMVKDQSPDGWIVYHQSEAGDVPAHRRESGQWFYQPDDWDDGEIYSLGFPTRAAASDAAEDEVMDRALSAAEDRAEL